MKAFAPCLQRAGRLAQTSKDMSLSCLNRTRGLACLLMFIPMGQLRPQTRLENAAAHNSNPPPQPPGPALSLVDATERQRGERQITRARCGHILTNIGVWSPDSQWLVYDTRTDAPGESFNGSTIEMVNIRTGEVREVYRSKHGAHCGVVTFHPHLNKVVFILGPENPTPDWQYGFTHRQGVIADVEKRGDAKVIPAAVVNLDACDLTPPFTAGALRGGSHVHVWDPAGEWVSFTYEDHVVAQFKEATPDNDTNLRNIGVSAPIHAVRVRKDHARNHDGEYFTVLVTRTTANPRPGSDEIKKAFEEGWVGANGYIRVNGARQRHQSSWAR